MIELVIPGDILSDLRPNVARRLHYLEQARRQRRWREKTWLCWLASGRPRIRRKVRLEFTIRRPRRCDPDHALTALCPVINGLRDQAGQQSLLPDDSDAWVEYAPIRWETGDKWRGHEEVRVRCKTVDEGGL